MAIVRGVQRITWIFQSKPLFFGHINVRDSHRPSADVAAKVTTTMVMAARRRRDDGTSADPPADPAAGTAGAARVTAAAVAAGEAAPVGGRRGGAGPDPVSRGGFFASVATVVLGGSALLTGATLGAPEAASANGMLDFPPARLNNRYFLMRAGQGGKSSTHHCLFDSSYEARRSSPVYFFVIFSLRPRLGSLVAPGADKEGLVQSHPIDKLHMDNRLTEQGVEEVSLIMASIGLSQNYA